MLEFNFDHFTIQEINKIFKKLGFPPIELEMIYEIKPKEILAAKNKKQKRGKNYLSFEEERYLDAILIALYDLSKGRLKLVCEDSTFKFLPK